MTTVEEKNTIKVPFINTDTLEVNTWNLLLYKRLSKHHLLFITIPTSGLWFLHFTTEKTKALRLKDFAQGTQRGQRLDPGLPSWLVLFWVHHELGGYILELLVLLHNTGAAYSEDLPTCKASAA